jgi:hypothetical protein
MSFPRWKPTQPRCYLHRSGPSTVEMNKTRMNGNEYSGNYQGELAGPNKCQIGTIQCGCWAKFETTQCVCWKRATVVATSQTRQHKMELPLPWGTNRGPRKGCYKAFTSPRALLAKPRGNRANLPKQSCHDMAVHRTADSTRIEEKETNLQEPQSAHFFGTKSFLAVYELTIVNFLDCGYLI